MSRMIRTAAGLLVFFAACAPAAKQSGINSSNNLPPAVERQPMETLLAAGPQAASDGIIPSGLEPSNLLHLPVSERGEIILSEGFYEADFKSYCLQPGTPDPTNRDAYLSTPLAGPRKDILETALRNSLDKPYLDQKNIQLLLWSVVSGSNFDRLAPEVKYTARQLLTPKQVFQLKGGVMGVVQTVASVIPDQNISGTYNQVRNLFELGQHSYEVYERMAVLRTPSVIHRPDYKRDQWHRHPDGYFLRYYPRGYQMVHVQLYVPKDLLDSTGKRNGDYVLFDPVATMASPANSNAQRLGIGAPVVDVIRTVIRIQQQSGTQRPVVKSNDPQPKQTGKGGTYK